MTTFREAVKKLQIIYNDCAPEAKNKRKEENAMDEFSRLRKSTHAEVKRTREMLKEREELLSAKPGSKEAAEASHKIRSKLKQLREDAARMSSLQKQEEKKKKPEAVTQAKEREEVVQLVYKHIEELESLEKKRFTDKVNAERSVLFQGATSVKIEMTNFSGKPGGAQATSDLPDIDPDPEVGAGLQMLNEGNKDIDRDLDQIHVQVGALKEIAINMDRELDKQNAMLETIDKKVDKAQAHIDSVNTKMKNAVDGVMKGDKFMMSVSEVEAATKLQSIWRGYTVRKENQKEFFEENSCNRPNGPLIEGVTSEGTPPSLLSGGESSSKSSDDLKIDYTKELILHKSYMGGFVDTTTGRLHFHAAAQTLFAHDLKERQIHFHRNTQTVELKNRTTQTKVSVATQTIRKGLYQSTQSDRIIVIKGQYETADQFHYRRRVAAIKIQAFFRAILASREFNQLMNKKIMNDEYKRAKAQTRKRVQEMVIEREAESKLAPRTKSDFEALFTELNEFSKNRPVLRKTSVAQVQSEVEQIRTITTLKHQSDQAKEKERLMHTLERIGEPIAWRGHKGEVLQLDNAEMKRARELNRLYEALDSNMSNDERLKLLLNLRYTVQEFKTPLTAEILQLIARESDWISRGRPSNSLKGLRQRLLHLFLQFLRTPEFNPAILRYPDHQMVSMKQCISCTKFKPLSTFTSSTKCNSCLTEYNRAVLRLNDKDIKDMLKWIAVEESLKAKHLQDLFRNITVHEYDAFNNISNCRTLVEKVWKCRSAISGDTEDEISNLIFTRWNILKPLEPRNIILLRKDEAVKHDRIQLVALANQPRDSKIEDLIKVAADVLNDHYQPLFINKITNAHLIAASYM